MTEPTKVLLHSDETSDLVRMLRTSRPEVEIAECGTYEGLPGMLASFRPDIVYSVRFAGTPGFPAAALLGPDGPRWIANGGVGTDHFGVWDPERVTITNAAGVAARMMAEYILGGFLHFLLDVPGFQRDKAARVWGRREVAQLSGGTLLIVGLGKTGQALAHRATPFGVRVIGTRARPRAMPDVHEVYAAADLPDLLPQADFIAVTAPLTPATRGLIGAGEIEMMKPGVILADVSRGGIVDQSALHDALVTGLVQAAVLDVFETEPLPRGSPLWALENVIISPHCASVYPGWAADSFDMFLQNLDRWMLGQDLDNVVDPALGY